MVESDSLMGNSPLKDSCLRWLVKTAKNKTAGKVNKKQGRGENEGSLASPMSEPMTHIYIWVRGEQKNEGSLKIKEDLVY